MAGSSQEPTSEPRCQVRCSERESCSMPHDPARVADTKAWLDRVATDLRSVALDLAADPPITAISGGYGRAAHRVRLDVSLPGEREGPTRDEAERVLAIARETVQAILARLPEDARP